MHVYTVGTEHLLKWAAETADITCSSLAADNTLAVRGVVATQYIPRKAVIISMPRKMVLAVAAGQSSPMPDLVPQKIWKNCDE